MRVRHHPRLSTLSCAALRTNPRLYLLFTKRCSHDREWLYAVYLRICLELMCCIGAMFKPLFQVVPHPGGVLSSLGLDLCAISCALMAGKFLWSSLTQHSDSICIVCICFTSGMPCGISFTPIGICINVAHKVGTMTQNGSVLALKLVTLLANGTCSSCSRTRSPETAPYTF